MNTTEFDVIVVGGGAAGMMAADENNREPFYLFCMGYTRKLGT